MPLSSNKRTFNGEKYGLETAFLDKKKAVKFAKALRKKYVKVRIIQGKPWNGHKRWEVYTRGYAE